jgi:FkbM family methyltransferase
VSGMRPLDALVRNASRAYRRSPIKPFRGLLVRLLRAYSLRRREVVTATIDGIRYRLDLSEMIDSNVLLLGGHEPKTMATVRRHVSGGDIALDIGANAGYYTLPLAQCVGPTGRVFAFEPTQWAYEKLQVNLGLNDFTNIQAEKLALTDSPGRREVSSSETAFRASWPLAGRPQSRPGEVVEFVTLDDYLRDNNVEAVDFLKVDVDGFELRVVRGAVETLRRFRPSMLIEIGKATEAEVGDDPLELVRLLDELGYTFYDDEGRMRFQSPEAVVDAITWDEPLMVLGLHTSSAP